MVETGLKGNMGKGYSYVTRMIGSQNLSKEERQKDDYYATDPQAVEGLLNIEEFNDYIWEPACGEGHISKVLASHDHIVFSTDLVDRGYGMGGIDFLKTNFYFDGDIVTNPPFNKAQKFVEHAMSLVPDGSKICMLLKVQFLEGKGRKSFFEKYPPKTIWVSSSRIKCGRNGNFDKSKSMLALCWIVWVKGYKGEPVVRWFN